MNPLRKLLIGTAIAGATLTGGALGASIIGTAGAQTTSTAPAAASASATATPTTAAADPAAAPADSKTHRSNDPSKGDHQANGKTETVLTGDEATKAIAAAQAAVYEVHMAKADGSDVTVKLDAGSKVTETLNGHG